ncbi:diacylglycerol kinase [Amphritea opalescens]|uniref:Diacylglycerol kinase n=1 Tax=Amphritea opalescens TaxID=2490544 RepID=A0A430KRS6_9GAMM|nr:diacylglycerol kinase [Amphritea opalescens]RTE66192.1 diacylglycerol kinase [Amphritea opalescens]
MLKTEQQSLATDASALKGIKGVKRLVLATGYSIKGFQAAWQHEAAIRQETLCALVLIPLALYLGQDSIERILLIASVLLLILVELLNSAIEAVVDRIGTELHELSGRAKDMGSAAVLMALMIALMTWGLIIL